MITITEAAKLAGKSTQTLYRHIKAGKLSRSSDGTIDTTELLRVYGEINNNDVTSHASEVAPKSHPDTDHIKWLERQIDELRNDIKELKTESNAREVRLMALLEHKMDTQTAAPESTGLFSKLFK